MTPPLEATPLGDVVMLKMKEGIRRSRSTTSVRSWAARHGKGLDAMRFLHRSCKPLDEVDLRPKDEKSGQRNLFSGFQDECEGYCGN